MKITFIDSFINFPVCSYGKIVTFIRIRSRISILIVPFIDFLFFLLIDFYVYWIEINIEWYYHCAPFSIARIRSSAHCYCSNKFIHRNLYCPSWIFDQLFSVYQFNMETAIELNRTKTQPGAPAIQTSTDLYRLQKQNKNGTVRWTCTSERCNASIIMRDNNLISIRRVYQHVEWQLPFHIGQIVNDFRRAVANNIRTPIPQIYDQFAKKFVCWFHKQSVNRYLRGLL